MQYLKLESTGKRLLERFPRIKCALKRVYQWTMYSLERDKIKAEGEIRRISPDDGYEYFFGYYDQSPWDGTGRYILPLRV
jgi:hypothetical protein